MSWSTLGLNTTKRVCKEYIVIPEFTDAINLKKAIIKHKLRPIGPD